jgi:hypothetical protein
VKKAVKVYKLACILQKMPDLYRDLETQNEKG